MSNMGSSGSRLPLVVGGGCAGLLLLGLALIGLGVCGLVVAAMSRGQGPQPIRPATPAVRPVGTPGAPSGGPSGGGPGGGPVAPAPSPGMGGEPMGGGLQGGPGGPVAPAPGGTAGMPPEGPSGGAAGGGGFTLVQTGGYTCDLNANQCRPLTSGVGSAVQVRALGDGSIQVQFPFGGLRVNRDCSLVDQPGYTLFPCPFFPNVQGFQGLLVTSQGAQPMNTPFQYALIDTDFDQDGVVNEPGYYSHSSGSLAFEAYREDGTLKFAGYIVDTGNYTYLYVFTYAAR
ncbi:hypothetical protein [Thermoflexus hugenholtzii]